MLKHTTNRTTHPLSPSPPLCLAHIQLSGLVSYVAWWGRAMLLYREVAARGRERLTPCLRWMSSDFLGRHGCPWGAWSTGGRLVPAGAQSTCPQRCWDFSPWERILLEDSTPYLEEGSAASEGVVTKQMLLHTCILASHVLPPFHHGSHT